MHTVTAGEVCGLRSGAIGRSRRSRQSLSISDTVSAASAGDALHSRSAQRSTYWRALFTLISSLESGINSGSGVASTTTIGSARSRNRRARSAGIAQWRSKNQIASNAVTRPESVRAVASQRSRGKCAAAGARRAEPTAIQENPSARHASAKLGIRPTGVNSWYDQRRLVSALAKDARDAECAGARSLSALNESNSHGDGGRTGPRNGWRKIRCTFSRVSSDTRRR